MRPIGRWGAALAAAALVVTAAGTGGIDARGDEVVAPRAPAPAPGEGLGQPVAMTREMNLYVEKWKWSPETIRVPKGTHLILHITSFDASRAFSLKPFGVKAPLKQGDSVTVEFDADKEGTFTWTCSRPCGDGCPKLKGTLIVTPARLGR